jgi:hypothetical protein
MTAQTLYGTLQFLDNIDRELSLQAHLETIRDQLDSLASAPAQPQHQQALANELKELTSSCAQLAERITPSRAVLINEIGGAEFFDPAIAENVHQVIATNAMSRPSRAILSKISRIVAILSSLPSGKPSRVWTHSRSKNLIFNQVPRTLPFSSLGTSLRITLGRSRKSFRLLTS